MREDWIKEVCGWQDGNFHQPIIGVGVLVGGFQDDGWMANRVLTVFIHPSVLGGDTPVPDLFPLGRINMVVECPGSCSAAKEGLSRL